ncbi:Gfo/Idh/MocA family protein [Micromonospora sediminimaris]
MARQMMSDPLRLALVGCGRQMRQNLQPFLHRLPAHQTVACVDPDPDLVASMGAVTRATVLAGAVEELDLSTIDAALIAVPPIPSFQITDYLVRRGVHCFVEKPAAPSTPALRQLDEVIQGSGLHVQVGFNFRYAETLQHLHALTAAARRAPVETTIDFYSRHPSAPQWGCDTTLESWLRQNGVHAFDLARWFSPAQVRRVDAHAIRNGEHRFLINVTLRHEDGSLTTLRMGNHTKSFLVGLSVHTVDGSRFTAGSLEQIRLDVDAGRPSGTLLHSTRNLDDGWARSGFGPELAAFLDHCRGKAPTDKPAPIIGDALGASILIDQALAQLGSAPHLTAPAGGNGKSRRADRVEVR